MNEWNLVWLLPVKLIPSVVFMVCYAIGGRHFKWIRRYLGPILFSASCAILAQFLGSFSWKIAFLLVIAPILTLPYHSDDERLRYVLALTAISLVFGTVFHSHLGYLQALLSFVTGIFFTETHPTDAVNEEGLIALLSVVVIPFMVM